jgi:hypothetical protein
MWCVVWGVGFRRREEEEEAEEEEAEEEEEEVERGMRDSHVRTTFTVPDSSAAPPGWTLLTTNAPSSFSTNVIPTPPCTSANVSSSCSV